MQSGVQLSTQEMQTAQQLAQVEENYDQALQANQTAIQEAQIGQEYQILNPSQTLANTFTGGTQRFR